MSSPIIRDSSAAIGSNDPPTSFTTIPQPLLGSYIVVWVFTFASVTTGLSDSAGNTYTSKKTVQDANGNWLSLFTAPVTATGTGTLTIGSTVTGGALAAHEVTGNSSSTPDDGIQSGTFSSSSAGVITSAPMTTTNANDLIISAVIDQNTAAITVNTGTLVLTGTTADKNVIQARSVSSPGGYSESFNMPASAGNTGVMIAIAIKGTSPPAAGMCEPDGWDFSSDDVMMQDVGAIVALVECDSRAIYRIDIVVLEEFWYEAEGDYFAEPTDLDTEWSGPVMPNAPPTGFLAFGGGEAELFVEDDTRCFIENGYLQSNAEPQIAESDQWDWDESLDDNLSLLLTSDVIGASVIASPAMGPSSGEVEFFTDDYLPTLIELGYLTSDGAPLPGPPGTIYDDEVATVDDFVEEFFADHFGNEDADIPLLQHEWDGASEEAEHDWTQFLDQFTSANAPPATPLLCLEDAWDFNTYIDDDTELYGFSDLIVGADGLPIPIEPAFEDPASLMDHEVEEFFADHFGNTDAEIPVLTEEWLLANPEQEDDITAFTNEPIQGLNATLTLCIEDPWDWSAEFAEDPDAIYMMVLNSNDSLSNEFLAIEPPWEDQWDWHTENGEDADAFVAMVANESDSLNTDAVDTFSQSDQWDWEDTTDTVLPPDDYVLEDTTFVVPPSQFLDDAWDFFSDDTTDDCGIEEYQNADVVIVAPTTFNTDEWDFSEEAPEEFADYEQFISSRVDVQQSNEDWYEWDPNYIEEEWLVDTETATDIPDSQTFINEPWEWDQLEPQEESWEWEGNQTSTNISLKGRKGFFLVTTLGAVQV